MRVKDKRLSDYGITSKNEKEVKNYCRNADYETLQVIKAICMKLYPDVGDGLFESLVNKMSYSRLYARNCVYLSEGAFYGYRRRLIAVLYKVMLAIEE